MTDEDRVVSIIREFNRPVGWYPVAQTLSMRGILLDQRLPDVLDSLVKSNTIQMFKVDGKNRYEV
jgi:hypothetical protein